jgi:hypothetical protein
VGRLTAREAEVVAYPGVLDDVDLLQRPAELRTAIAGSVNANQDDFAATHAALWGANIRVAPGIGCSGGCSRGRVHQVGTVNLWVIRSHTTRPTVISVAGESVVLQGDRVCAPHAIDDDAVNAPRFWLNGAAAGIGWNPEFSAASIAYLAGLDSRSAHSPAARPSRPPSRLASTPSRSSSRVPRIGGAAMDAPSSCREA